MAFLTYIYLSISKQKKSNKIIPLFSIFPICLQIIIKPQLENGLIVYSGHREYGDYISLSLNNGYVEFALELGSGPAVVR